MSLCSLVGVCPHHSYPDPPKFFQITPRALGLKTKAQNLEPSLFPTCFPPFLEVEMSIPLPLGVQVGVYPLGAAVRRGAKPHLTGISAHVCNCHLPSYDEDAGLIV